MMVASVETNFKGKQLQGKVDRSKRRLLFGFGAYASKTASRSMKRAPKKAKTTHGETRIIRSGKRAGESRFVRGEFSRPGDPPHRRAQGKGLHTIEFKVDLKRSSVKYGPIRLPSKSKHTSRLATQTMEFGGTITIKRRLSGRRSTRGRVRSSIRAPMTTSTQRATYKKRPFVNPAGIKAIKNLRKRAKGSIR